MKVIEATFFVVVCALLVLSCVSQQKLVRHVQNPALLLLRQPAADYVGGYDYESYIDNSPKSNITCNKFFSLLNKAHPKPDTVIEALQILRQYKPSYFSRYVLLPNSMSLQESSYTNPRAMVYGGDGRMVMTFNGDPRQRGYEGLELMCFNELMSSFEFREITFPKEASGELEYLSEIDKRKPFVISPINSSGIRDCRQCHMTPTRPNWDSYPVWPSSFGALDDSIFRKEFREKFLLEGSFDHKYTEAELAVWRRFSKTGRYAILGDNSMTERPNLVVGKMLGILNAKRIVAELKRLPEFEKVRKSFAQALYCPVEGIERKEFMVFDGSAGRGVTMDVLVPPIDPDVKRISKASSRYFRGKESRLESNFDIGSQSNYGRDEPASLVVDYYRSIGFSDGDAVHISSTSAENSIRLANIEKIVKPLGIDIQNWSLIPNGGYEFEDGSGGELGSSFVQVLDKPFLEAFFSNDDILIELVRRRRTFGEGPVGPEERFRQESEICEYLQ